MEKLEPKMQTAIRNGLIAAGIVGFLLLFATFVSAKVAAAVVAMAIIGGWVGFGTYLFNNK